MENFSLQQLIDLQNIQKELNSNKDTYLKTYRQVLKKKFRSELNNLVRADFNIVKSELKVPQLPPLPPEDENPTVQHYVLDVSPLDAEDRFPAEGAHRLHLECHVPAIEQSLCLHQVQSRTNQQDCYGSTCCQWVQDAGLQETNSPVIKSAGPDKVSDSQEHKQQ
uniref:GG24784 n=1 Tax=Drosophila erecta TaxID=7220 RepID=B3NYU2_DROER